MTTLIPNGAWFLDDRSKDDRVLMLDSIVWCNEQYALCKVEREEQLLLVDIRNSKVLNSDYDSWYATNDIGDALKRLDGFLSETVASLAEIDISDKTEYSVKHKAFLTEYIQFLEEELSLHRNVIATY